MRIVAWNCRGLGNGPAIRGLLELQKEEGPDVLFLSETKHDGKWLDWLRWRLGLSNMVAKDSVRASGGLAVFWRKGIDLAVKSMSKYHIDMIIKEEDDFEWRFSGIYGESRSEEKEKTWDTLRTLHGSFDLPWLCAGDFNEVLFEHEKEGGLPRSETAMEGFRRVLEDCDLHDLGCVGDVFTWRNNHHSVGSYTRERLDRALANTAWRCKFPLVRVINGDPRHSDHRPVIVEVGERELRRWEGPREVLRSFEARWLEEEECAAKVEEAWNLALLDDTTTLLELQGRVLGELWEWDRSVLGELKKRVKNARRELEKCRRRGLSQEALNREHVLRFKLERLEDQLHVYWKQRAHNSWLLSGDRNTKFFHAFASERKRKNGVKRLVDEGGGEVKGDRLKTYVTDQYQSLFFTQAGGNVEEVTGCVRQCVTREMNNFLLAPYSGEEVWKALESIGDLKAPGVDGIPAIFYKRFWGLIGERVKLEVLKVLNGGEMPPGWNDTIIVLIPKTDRPERLKDLRPISLCTVLYKLISKVMANRLKVVLPDVISPSQSAFVPGRLITDNVLLAYEITHYLKNKREGAMGAAAIKLDMKGLSAMLQKAERDRKIVGIKVCRTAPSVNHLFFADDSLILMRARSEEAAELKRILGVYERVSGQVINKEKSSILFGPNTSRAVRDELKTTLSISQEKWGERYLGLPVSIGISKKKTFAYLKQRIWCKVQGWQEKMLSKAGKEILIKSVAQAIPTYAMSCFDITKTLCDELSTMAWRLLTNPESLCGKVLKAKYFPNSSILECQAKDGISYSWRSILQGVELLKKGLVWRVGDGRQIRIWTDPWIPRGETRRPATPRGNSLLTGVDELMDPISGGWDEQLVWDTFWREDAEAILSIPIGEGVSDRPAWHFDSKGLFSVKSAYKVAVQHRDNETGRNAEASGGSTMGAQFPWHKIWQMKVPNKIQMFLWRFAHNSLPVRNNLKRRKIKAETVCPMCKRFDEDCGHIFFNCKNVRECWRVLQLEEARCCLAQCRSGKEVIEKIWTMSPETQVKIVVWLWRWWTARNKANAGERIQRTGDVCNSVYYHLTNFAKLKGPAKQRDQSPKVQWNPPPDGQYKLNVDAAFSSVTRRGGWGCVVRNNAGVVLDIGTGSIQRAGSALHAEALAALHGLERAEELGMTRIILETDASNLGKALTTDRFDSSLEGWLIVWPAMV
ncbi:hypothetical protein U9M48_011922 [Paspalum notatum var. saurae]|uniref:Reverse transcriptase n=1 Tax=Paspalum notatum var. saurae TaxID=547442 RepID=A0AAQ3WHU8_PASNO